MKRMYKQSIFDDEGIEMATRVLVFDEDEETYKRPIFLAALMAKEEQFLKERFEVVTVVIEEKEDEKEKL